MATLTAPLQRLKATPAYLTIGLGAVLVVWQAVAGPLPERVQWLVFAGLLIVAGIPHGALDHLIDQETAARLGKSFSLAQFLVRYLLTMAVYGAAWFVAPALSLLLFLLGSAWHFGETDIERVPLTPAWSVTRCVAGGFVLAFILLTHATEVTPILDRITHADPATMSVWKRAVRYGSAVWLYWGLLTGYLFVRASRARPVAVDWHRLARLAAVLALGYWLPLLPAFGLYFGGWHALSSFQTIHGYLKSRSAPLTAGQVWLKSVPFTALALVSLAGFAWWWQQYARHWDPLPLIFIFLSLITLPHLNVMHGMNRRGNEGLRG